MCILLNVDVNTQRLNWTPAGAKLVEIQEALQSKQPKPNAPTSSFPFKTTR